ncbi:hypothetical protein QJQ45_030282, partial [Haematococcus lacustris]
MAALGMAVEGNKFEMDQKVREAVKAYQERQKQEAEEAEALADSLEPVVDLVEQAMLKGPEAAVAELNTRALKLQCEMRQLSAMGTRQVLSKRLLTALRSEMPQEEKPPLLAIAREVGLEKAVQALGMRDLREELGKRGLYSSGSRAGMETRLVEALTAEAEKASTFGSRLEDLYGGEPRGDVVQDDGEDQLLEPISERVRLMIDDPAITVTVLFGGPGVDLETLQSSLEAAVCVAESLSTAWDPTSFTAVTTAPAVAEVVAQLPSWPIGDATDEDEAPSDDHGASPDEREDEAALGEDEAAEDTGDEGEGEAAEEETSDVMDDDLEADESEAGPPEGICVRCILVCEGFTGVELPLEALRGASAANIAARPAHHA